MTTSKDPTLRALRHFIAVALVTFGPTSSTIFLAAQVQQATIEGTVTDTTGLPVPGASVDVHDTATNQHRLVMTSDDGHFIVPNLVSSTYTIRVELFGFTPFEQPDIPLSVGQIAKIAVTLSPAGISQSVTVSAKPPAVDPARTAVSTTVIDTERIEELPVRSRNYLEFVLLAPAVVRSPGGAPSPGAVSLLSDSGFSFAGLRPRSNTLTIDGLENNDEFSGGSRTELSLEIVREFQVVTSGWSAESGGASGGAINVVTKGGSNILHGDAFLFAQSGRLNARPKLEDPHQGRPSLKRFRGGLAFGGPLVADRTFYYTAGEQEEARGQSALHGLFPASTSETELSLKLTHRITNRHALTGRMAATNRRESGAPLGDALRDPSARGTHGVRDVAATGVWTMTGRRFTNDVRLQAAGRRAALSSADPNGRGVLIPGVVALGPPYVLTNRNEQRYLQAGDTFAVAAGRHLVKLGADALHVGVTATHPAANSLFIFQTVSDWPAGTPDSSRQMVTGPATELATVKVGMFAQDHWSVTSSVTIDGGVRVDAQTVGPTLDVRNWLMAPRGGIAWAPTAKWVIRGGAGLFADRLPLAMFERASALDGVRGFEQITTRTSGPPRPSIYTARPGNWRSSSTQASIGIERGLTPETTAAVSSLFVRGRHLPRTVNVNLPPPVTRNGRPVFGERRLNPAYADVFEVQPTASSTYRGVTATVNRRLAQELEWSASYTWSRATDTASDFDEQPQNPYAPPDESAPSRYDQRHRAVVHALFDLPVGEEEDRKPGQVFPWWIRAFANIEIAPILTIASGRRVNPIVGADVSGSHAFGFADRPPGFGRNSLRLPASATLDLRVLKFFAVQPHGKLDLVVEAFNLLNRTNVAELNNVYGPGAAPNADFGRPIAASTARQIQFSIDFEF